MTSPDTPPPEPTALRASRRRLLLGATGALPSVLTLSSGAQAAILSHLSCIKPPAQMPERFTPTDDGWVRAQVQVGNYQGMQAYCITTPNSGCVDMANPSRAAQGSEWIVGGSPMTSSSLSQVNVSSGQHAYALVYVDQHGAMTMINPRENTNFVPVADSCWTSVIGGSVSKLG